jgi:ABC-type sugar transport system substrate-binding protein
MPALANRSAPGRRRPVAVVVAALVAVLAVVLSGCGGSAEADASGSSSGLSSKVRQELETKIETAKKAATFTDPGPAIDAAKVAGKGVFFLVNSTQLPFVQGLINGVKEAGAAAGVKVTVGDGQNQATEQLRLLQQAVSQKPGAIITFGSTPDQLASGLKAAKAAGIPVVETVVGDPGLPSKQDTSQYGIVSNATYCYSCAAALIADHAILEKNGKVNALMTLDPVQASSAAQKKGFQGEFDKYCPKTCTVKYVDTPTTDSFRSTGSAVQAAVQGQQVNFVFPQYDGYIEAVLPELKSGDAAKRITVGSYNADLAQMKEMASGTPVTIDVGSPVAWLAWGFVDEALRAMVGAEPAKDENLPVRVFDTKNVKSIDLSTDPGTWYGDIDYRASYQKLWGVK